ncbi:MAG: hypothetical protein ACRD5F_00645, partial [Candidatus Acidiferrales bacterium]
MTCAVLVTSVSDAESSSTYVPTAGKVANVIGCDADVNVTAAGPLNCDQEMLSGLAGSPSSV